MFILYFFTLINLVIFSLTGCIKGSSSALDAASNSATQALFLGVKSAINLNGTSVQINWDLPTSSTISEYHIFQIASDGSYVSVGKTDSQTNQLILSGLTAGKLYSYIVRSTYTNGTIDNNTLAATALTFAGVTSSTVIDATSASLQYPATTDAATFRIYCATGNSTNFILFTTVNSSTSSTTLSNLTTNVLYNCKVKALLSGGNEDSNSLVTSFKPQAVALNSSFGFAGVNSVTNTNGTTLNIAWPSPTPTPGTTIQTFRINILDPSDNLSIYDVAFPTLNYSLTNLIEGANFNVIVRALDSSGNSDGNQKMLSAFTYRGITSAALSSPATTPPSAVLIFPAAANASALHVYCSISGGAIPTSPTLSIASTLTTATVTGLSTGSNYICKVKAVGSTGEDTNTATAVFTTP